MSQSPSHLPISPQKADDIKMRVEMSSADSVDLDPGWRSTGGVLDGTQEVFVWHTHNSCQMQSQGVYDPVATQDDTVIIPGSDDFMFHSF